MSSTELWNKNDLRSNNRLVSKRHYLRRKFLLTAAATVLTTRAGLYYADQFEPNDIEVTRTDVHLPHWPVEADGLKVGFISDFHNDYQGAIDRSATAAWLLMDENPDMAIFGGDLVTNQATEVDYAPTMLALEPLTTAPLGAFAIMGNHDSAWELHQVATKMLSSIGFAVLNNRSVPIKGVPNSYIVGLDDGWFGYMDVRAALHNVPASANKLVLMHEPDFADFVGTGFDLQISGHSHGGQVRIPGFPVLYAPLFGRQYPIGLQQAKNHLVYTSRGVGMVGLQIRSFCPPEVTVLTLRTRQ